MKHHFGDMLDRSGGHWSIVPNVERHAYHVAQWTSAQRQVSIATISNGDMGWEMVETFPNLEELTLHSPSQEQLAFVPRLWRLKRLRITHAKLKDIGFLSHLQNLKEVILEYVSGFDDISPIGDLSNLRALHVENLRKVSDFSGLKGAHNLQYLGIYGTVDWSQPIESFDFIGKLGKLEYLALHFIKSLDSSQPLESAKHLPKLRKIDISMNAFPINVFAWIEANLGGVEGAVRPAFVKFGGEDQPIHSRDLRSRMPIEGFEKFPNLFVGPDGKRYQRIPYQASLLGRSQRGLSGSKDKVDKACDLHAHTYAKLVSQLKNT